MGALDPLYAALGVSPEASPEDVKKAFRKVARECHPDVAGDDPAKAERFKAARDAYEVLTDGTKRALFEAQAQEAAAPRAPRKGRNPEEAGAFFRAFYKRASGGASGPEPKPNPRQTHAGSFRARNASTGGPADGLDDLFSDFGFGQGAAEGPRARQGAPSQGQGRRGDDVILDLDVPADVAMAGGTVMANYVHLVRDPSWKPGDPTPGVIPKHDQVPLSIEPGTRHGNIRRFRGLGDAGPQGGTIGDLVCRVRVLDEPEERSEARPHSSTRSEGRPRPEPPRGAEARSAEARRTEDREARADGSGRQVVDITLFEALLGGRIEVSTPSGRVRVVIPPCTSSGRQLRLKGRGPLGIDGQAGDLVLELRIVVPPRLDEPSVRLVEELARLNPEVPER